MQPDYPWNVVGIPVEAREAARAAARREGLPVGEWLSRRIARRLADEHQTVGKDESLGALDCKLDALSAAVRRQAEAFVHLADRASDVDARLSLLERQATPRNIKVALEALRLGLSQLAGELARTSRESITQMSGLRENIDAVAKRLDRFDQQFERAAREIAVRISEFDGRLYLVEKNSGRISGELESIRATHRLHEEALERHASNVSGCRAQLGQLRAMCSAVEENVARHSARIDDLAAKMETPLDLKGRLEAIEERTSSVVGQLEGAEITYANQGKYLERMLHDCAARIDSIEQRGCETAENITVRARDETEIPISEALPSDTPVPGSTPELPDERAPDHGVSPDSAAAAEDALPDSLPTPLEPQQEPFALSGQAAAESASAQQYVNAARRSVGIVKSFEQAPSPGTNSWAFSRHEPQSRIRYVIVAAFATVIGAAILAGIILNQRAESPPRKSSQIAAIRPGVFHGGRSQAERIRPVAREPNTFRPPAPVAVTQRAQPAPLPRLITLARSGDAKAELLLGIRYLKGEGLGVNEADAARWLARAAQKGEPVAQYRLGTLYERGRGVPVDGKLAAFWYGRAAEQGNARAMYDLAVAYAKGSGEPKDYGKAATWFRKAAELGITDAQFNLAVLYERGIGVKQSLAEAYKWYAIASKHGDAGSTARVAILITQLSPKARAIAERAATAFRPQSLNSMANTISSLE